MQPRLRQYTILAIFASFAFGFLNIALAESTKVTDSGIKFPDGTTQTTAATGGSSPWSQSGSNIYYNGGKVGIGTANPDVELEIAASNEDTTLHVTTYSTDNTKTPGVQLRRSYSEIMGTKSETNVGDLFGCFNFMGVNSSGNFTYGAVIEAFQEGASGSVRIPSVLHLYTFNGSDSNKPQLVLTSNSNVGVGTASPGSKLDVAGTVTANAFVGDGSALTGISGTSKWSDVTGGISYSEGNVGIGITSPSVGLDVFSSASDVVAQFVRDLTTDTGIAIGGSNDGGNFRTIGLHNMDFYTNTTFRLRIDTTGNVGIGTVSPSYPLEMASGAHVTTAGVWTDASSRDYKENIRDLTYDEAKLALSELSPSKFNYKVDKDDEYVGFIAEDVPDLVATKDRKGLSPMDIVAVLTKVVQEQQERIEALEAALNQKP